MVTTLSHRRWALALLVVAAAASGSAALLLAAPSGPDLTRLPLGDRKLTTTPKSGYVMRCVSGNAGIGGASKDGPWIDTAAGTFDITKKATVDGAISWPARRFVVRVIGGKRRVQTADLPAHTTGRFPIAANDDAYQFDQNPNRISGQNITLVLSGKPRPAATASCVQMGPIGVLLTGVLIYDALDAGGRDAVAHEVQDHCDGHPDPSSSYHYHSLTRCLRVSEGLVGYALDGFGIYGPREGGRTLTTRDLDACHGRTSVVTWGGRSVRMYHYVATADFPYTVSCFKGTPVRTRIGAPPGGGPPPGQP